MVDVTLTHLDDALFDGAGATKRDLVDYVCAVREPFLAALRDRPLSVVRVRPGQPAFMQKNLPAYAPDFVRRYEMWVERSRRTVAYAVCDNEPTLLWLANQRAVEFHVQLWHLEVEQPTRPDFLVLDLDPPAGDDPELGFGAAVRAALLVRTVLADLGLSGALKTSGAKGVHVFVPVDLTGSTTGDDAAAATRAIAARAAALDPDLATVEYIKADRGGKVFVDSTRAHNATVIAAYSPRLRPGVPVSFPIAWADALDVHPRDFTLTSAPGLLAGPDPWAAALPAPQNLPADLVAEGHEIPIARVAAMHEGKRRKRAAESS